MRMGAGADFAERRIEVARMKRRPIGDGVPVAADQRQDFLPRRQASGQSVDQAPRIPRELQGVVAYGGVELRLRKNPFEPGDIGRMLSPREMYSSFSRKARSISAE
jgi:hypothetical protein